MNMKTKRRSPEKTKRRSPEKTKRRSPEKKTLYEWIEGLLFDEYYYLYPEYTVYRTKFEQLYRKFLRQKQQSWPLHPRHWINERIRTIKMSSDFSLNAKTCKIAKKSYT